MIRSCHAIAALAGVIVAACVGRARTPFDVDAANEAIARTSLAACSTGAPLEGHVTVVFLPSGEVDSAVVDGGPMAGKPVASCVERVFRGVTIAPFAGSNGTARHSFHMK